MYTLVVTALNQEQDTYRIRGLKNAYAAYDRAIALGYYVDSFTTSSGCDIRDQPQPAMVYVSTPSEREE